MTKASSFSYIKYSGSNWEFDSHLNLTSGNSFKINSTTFNSTTIGTTVLNSSLKTLGNDVTLVNNSVLTDDLSEDTLIGQLNYKYDGFDIGSIQTWHSKSTNSGQPDREGYMSFYTKYRDDSNLSERLRITNNGNVGIGTTNPDKKLHVQGDIKVTGSIVVGDVTGDITGNAATATKIASISNDNIMTLDSFKLFQAQKHLVTQLLVP